MRWLKLIGGGMSAAFALGYMGRSRVAESPDEDDLTGEVALITGGSRGLGFLLAREFGRQGCRVAICARDSAELEEARQELSRLGIEALAVECDVADRTAVERLVDTVKGRWGRIDIVVNNASIIQVGPIETMRVEDLQAALDVNFWGAAYLTFAVLPDLLERGSGRIVNITSIGGKVSVPHLLPYNTAKFATVGFSEGLHAELAPKGIHVTTVVPGLMRTGSPFHGLFKGDEEREFAWFGVGDSLPILSMNATVAAQRIVAAVRRREAEIILTLPAALLARFHGLMPGITTRLLSAANRFILPEAPDDDPAATPGYDVYQDLDVPAAKPLMAPTRAAAERYNQFASSDVGPVDD